MISYFQILKNGLWLTWRNKKLLLFGIFTMIIGSAGEIEILFRSTSIGQPGTFRQLFLIFKNEGILSAEGFNSFLKASKNDPATFLQILFVLFLFASFGIFLTWAITVSHGALVHAIGQIDRQKSSSLKLNIRVGQKKFWPLFRLLLILQIINGLLFWALGKIIFIHIGIFTVLFLASIFVLIFLFVLLKYAACSIVYDNVRTFQGIKKSLKIFTKNISISIRMAIILFVLNILATAILTFLIFLISAPFFLILGTTFIIQSEAAFVFHIYLALVLAAILVTAVGSFMAVFHWSSWSLLYLELTNKKTSNE